MQSAVVLAAAVVLTGATVYTPCRVAREIQSIRVPKAGDRDGFEPLQCSERDIGRLVCVASLHNFDTDYRFTAGNETYVGIFGVPRDKARHPKSVSQSHQDFVAYQISLRFKRLTSASEVICNYYFWFMDNYYWALLKYWEMENSTRFGEHWNKRVVDCTDEKLKVFVVDEKFRKIYKPGVLKDFNAARWPTPGRDGGDPGNGTQGDDFFTKPCHGEFYCGDFSSCPTRPEPAVTGRTDKGRTERKVERLVKVVDWTIIVLWVVVVVGVMLGGYFYARMPRRRGRRQDDWGRPILTAHYSP